MDNTALRRTIWEGAIPCRIELDPSESRVFDGTDPFYVRVRLCLRVVSFLTV